jgi:hypothetical protein
MWFVYIQCWAMDVFSMDLPRDYISSPVINQKSVVDREQTRMKRVFGSPGRRVQLKIYCEVL